VTFIAIYLNYVFLFFKNFVELVIKKNCLTLLYTREEKDDEFWSCFFFFFLSLCSYLFDTGTVALMLEAVMAVVPVEKLAIHFHDTYGQSLPNILVSLQVSIGLLRTLSWHHCI
jgi:hypothetical protein